MVLCQLALPAAVLHDRSDQTGDSCSDVPVICIIYSCQYGTEDTNINIGRLRACLLCLQRLLPLLQHLSVEVIVEEVGMATAVVPDHPLVIGPPSQHLDHFVGILPLLADSCCHSFSHSLLCFSLGDGLISSILLHHRQSIEQPACTLQCLAYLDSSSLLLLKPYVIQH